ncbi:MAG: hypothetical protein ACOYM9_25385 [Bradymonadia bacterium]
MYLEPDPILPADEDVLPGLWLHARGDPYHVVDPDGRCGLVGAAVGGALGAALSGAFALYNGDDPATALARAVVGGVGGSVLGATCGLAASAGAGGVVGAFQGGVNTALDARGAPLTLAELGRGALVGGVGGALSGVAGGYLGGRTDLNAAGRLTLNAYADLGADLLAQGAGTALGGGPLDLERAIFAAAFGTGVRAVHLGGASAAAAVRARAAAVQREASVFSSAFVDEYTALRQFRGNLLYSTPVPYARELEDVVLATAHALRRYGYHRYAGYVQANPESWVVDRARGMLFDLTRRIELGTSETMHHEVFVECAGCRGGRARLDTWNRRAREIISRKQTQFASIREGTAMSYLHELATKYAPQTKVADVPSSRARNLDALRLEGALILEVPVQSKPIPQSVLDLAARLDIGIRDVNGRVY